MMPSPVNICASFPFPATLLTMLVLIAGCAGRPGLTSPWFDPTTPAFNGAVGQPGALAPSSNEARRAHARHLDREWAREEVEALEKQLAKERKAAGLNPRKARKKARRPARVKPPKPSVQSNRSRPEPTRPQVSARKTTRATERPKPRPPLRVHPPRKKPSAKTPRRAARTRPAPLVSPPTEPPPTPDGAQPRPGDKGAMGNGTVTSEMVAAARRLVGLAYDDDRNTFLRHLLVAAAVDVRVTAPREAFDALVVAALGQRGWQLTRAMARRGLKAGDLIVFATEPQLVAVVESVSPSGVATCIGPRWGRVGRFVMSLGFPKARRNEATKEILNDRVTKPGVTRSRQASATLAGELFSIALRPTFQ